MDTRIAEATALRSPTLRPEAITAFPPTADEHVLALLAQNVIDGSLNT
jgi:hypothetical protein